MKAVVYTTYGGPEVLRVQEIAAPVPQDHEVCVRVNAVPVSFGDLLARNFARITPRTFSMPSPFWLLARLDFGLRRPRKPILGSEFAGDVVAVGQGVTRFKPGDAVYGYRGQAMGAYAERLCMPENGLIAHKPVRLTDEEAAVIPYGALTALSLLRQVGVQPGQRVLINGASGGIGSAAVQLAKHHFGAEVTGVCSTPRMALVHSLGADHVIDYTREDYTRSGRTYDLIVDVLGKSMFAQARRALTADGRLLYVSFHLPQVAQMLWTARFSRQKVICALSMERPEDLRVITELVDAGKLRAVVDRCYPLEQITEAHRYAESGSKQGSVVIRLRPSPAG